MTEAVEAINATVFPSMYWQCPGTSLEDALAAPVGPKSISIDVRVNHGRWVAECPDCCGAQLTTSNDKRFMCNYCANVVVEGRWRPVNWPEDVEGITAALAPRTPALQNWFPTETVQDLVAENVEHGVGV